MDDRERWDAKYAGSLGTERKEPDPFVLACLDRLEPDAGRALDLAAGTGRHALALARRGWRTSAWDVSPIGLGILDAEAAKAGLAIETHALDVLAGGPLAGERFELVVVVDFFDRDLWDRLQPLVVAGGHVIARTFTRDWPGRKPPTRFRLEPGEIENGLPGFEHLLHEEEGGRAGFFGRRAPDGG
ncbi:MAG: methyltransferase domain-containing protein [Planctomycetota bacterium]|nr:methyltransferase domain-containing protein [Planctomycetota bacterium]